MADSQLVVFAGLPGTGKTSLARSVARQLRAAYFDKDTIKDTVMSLARELNLEQGQALAGPLSYELLLGLARDNLTLGLPVVLDSPAAYQQFRDRVKDLARSLKVDLKLIECICSDDELLRRRVESRGEELPDYRARDWATYERDRARYQRPTERRLTVDTAEPLTLNLRKVLAYLDQPGSSAGSD